MKTFIEFIEENHGKLEELNLNDILNKAKKITKPIGNIVNSASSKLANSVVKAATPSQTSPFGKTLVQHDLRNLE